MATTTQTISKSELRALSLLAAFAVALFAAVKLGALTRPSDPVVSMPTLEVIRQSATFLGSATAPYTLVVFSDYECPYCRATSNAVLQELVVNEGKVRVQYRELPLVNIHRYAMQASVLAETARLQGCFLPVHKYLYNTTLCEPALTYAELRYHLDKKMYPMARSNVLEDVSIATKLGIRQTPTFLLCCPNGHVVTLSALKNLAQYL